MPHTDHRKSERSLTSFDGQKTSLANACFVAADGDALLALDMAIDIAVKYHGPVIKRRMEMIRRERQRAAA